MSHLLTILYVNNRAITFSYPTTYVSTALFITHSYNKQHNPNLNWKSVGIQSKKSIKNESYKKFGTQGVGHFTRLSNYPS